MGQFSASRTVVQKVSQCWSCSTGEEARNSPLMILVLMFSSILVSRAFSLFSSAHSFSSLCPPLLCFQTLSGDSTINPALGRLVLQCLCPALHSLLTDGLKPHQSDLIAGRRPNSAWGLVQASTRPGSKKMSIYDLKIIRGYGKVGSARSSFPLPSIIFPNKGKRKQILIGNRFDCSSHLIWPPLSSRLFQGPKTQILFNLQVRVSELPQLRHSKQRFNAFLLGLLK